MKPAVPHSLKSSVPSVVWLASEKPSILPWSNLETTAIRAEQQFWFNVFWKKGRRGQTKFLAYSSATSNAKVNFLIKFSRFSDIRDRRHKDGAQKSINEPEGERWPSTVNVYRLLQCNSLTSELQKLEEPRMQINCFSAWSTNRVTWSYSNKSLFLLT